MVHCCGILPCSLVSGNKSSDLSIRARGFGVEVVVVVRLNRSFFLQPSGLTDFSPLVTSFHESTVIRSEGLVSENTSSIDH